MCSIIGIYLVGIIVSFILIAAKRDFGNYSAPYSLALIWPLWIVKVLYGWVKDVPNAFRYLKK